MRTRRTHSNETKNKMSSSHKKLWQGPEYARKIIDMSGDNNPAKRPEIRKKISLANTGRTSPNKGKKLSKETREKLSKSGKIAWAKEDIRKKICEGMKGLKHSEETKRKMSEFAKKRPEEHKEKIRLALLGRTSPMKGKKQTEETKKKNSISHRGMIGEKSSNWKGGISKNQEHLRELGRKGNHKRRGLKRGVDGSFTLGEWEFLKKQYGYKCPSCGKSEPQIILTTDHIIPISKIGSNYIENIQPLCKSCNSKKHTKIIKFKNGEG